MTFSVEEAKKVRLRMKERKALAEVTARRYQRAEKKGKGRILDEFTQTTGYGRCYAGRVLRNWGKKVYSGGVVYKAGGGRRRGHREKEYDEKVKRVLLTVWETMDFICGKRLAPVMGEIVGRLEHFGEISCDQVIREKLGRISASTIDRMLAPERRKHQLKGRSGTRPGTLLKRQIPMRTFSEWDENRPGFAEIDLVGHDGGCSSGEFLQTLDVTDVCSGWTELAAVRNKAQVWVFEALKDIRSRLPFPLLGIDSDNGGEFINHQLFRYCQEEQLTFTRSRPHRKNDNCFVEQKNWSVVRRHVGYQRLDDAEEMYLLNELYSYLRLYVNFFQPVMRLATKERNGAAVKKTYSKAETPYSKLLRSPRVTAAAKKALRKTYADLNPADLKRRISALQEKLMKLAAKTRRKTPPPRVATPWHETNSRFYNEKPLEYISS